MLKINEEFSLPDKKEGGGTLQVLSVDESMQVDHYRQEKIEAQAVMYMASLFMPKDDSIGPEERHALSIAAAIIKIDHGLALELGEVYIIPTRGGYHIDTGYKGMVKVVRAAEQRNNVSYTWGEAYFLTDEEKLALEYDKCPLCFGSGNNKYGQACKKCDGQGSFPVGSVVCANMHVTNVDDAIRMAQVGLEYAPTIGRAIWYPGDRVPTARTKYWVAEKNALKDALRRVAPITLNTSGLKMTVDVEQKSTGIEVDNRFTDYVKGLADLKGVKYDDPYAMSSFVANCTRTDYFEDEEEVIDTMAECQLNWSSSEVEKIKYSIFGHATGEFPLTERVFDSEKTMTGILLNCARIYAEGEARQKIEDAIVKGNAMSMTRRELGELFNS